MQCLPFEVNEYSINQITEMNIYKSQQLDQYTSSYFLPLASVMKVNPEKMWIRSFWQISHSAGSPLNSNSTLPSSLHALLLPYFLNNMRILYLHYRFLLYKCMYMYV